MNLLQSTIAEHGQWSSCLDVLNEFEIDWAETVGPVDYQINLNKVQKRFVSRKIREVKNKLRELEFQRDEYQDFREAYPTCIKLN